MLTPEEEASVKTFAIRMADIDFWLRFVKWSGISLLVLCTVAFGLAGWLYTFKINVDEAKSKVDVMETTIKHLEDRVNETSEHLSSIEKQTTQLRYHQLVGCREVTITSCYASKLVWRQTAKCPSPATNVRNSAASLNRVPCRPATFSAP